MIAVPILKSAVLVAIVYLVSFLLPSIAGKKKMQLAPLVIGAVGIAFQLVVNRGESFGRLGFGFSSPTVYLLGFSAVAGTLLVVLALGFATGKLRLREKSDQKRHSKLAPKLPLLLAQNVVIAIFTEELVFRGLIQRQLSQSISPVPAILVASAVFGIWHAPIGRLSLGLAGGQTALYALGTGLVGVVFGVFYHHSQSLVVSGFVHGVWNCMVYAIWGLGELTTSLLESRNETVTHPEYGLMGVLGLALAVPILLVMVV